ncbi:hypothetical protein BFF47_23370 [Shigella sp. FC1764]|nr:hypothetical protein BFF42_24825 [Shigella sp. FC1661]ODG84616.1 hypothetical protein BFF48_22960 [Shigella sp. FC1882]ODG85456.1 hypothetical protein BFF47_23370 [Shigella sp. FC1764]ODJ26823.1 hypothetical protein BFR11_24035 [Shigella sp. FC2383]ODJ32028.1 hypothetical protein BFR12_22865 [Shigella sp. FC2833]ODQ17927.1 hypothetical protein BGK49_15135 [Shigella sp. FC1544]ODQ20736.1 hypothetical protein BGK52_14900 [Shigella sp. FC1056]OEG29825.1 hypothetical protein BHQ32_23165 [Shig
MNKTLIAAAVAGIVLLASNAQAQTVPEGYQLQQVLMMKWSTKTGHRVRVFPVSIFRFVWG